MEDLLLLVLGEQEQVSAAAGQAAESVHSMYGLDPEAAVGDECDNGRLTEEELGHRPEGV